MAEDVKIPQFDIERIDAMVAQYRHSLETIYRIAYIQGQIDQANATRAVLAST